MITFFVTGQVLKVSAPTVAADTLNYLTARFVFQTADWRDVMKIAHFSNGDESADVELTDDEISADDGLNLTAGKWDVSLTGHRIMDGEQVQRITTNITTFTVVPSGVQDGEPLPSLPSVGEQILAQMEELRDEAEQSAASASGSASSAASSASSAEQSASAASTSATNAQTSANTASGAASAAQTSAGNAAQSAANAAGSASAASGSATAAATSAANAASSASSANSANTAAQSANAAAQQAKTDAHTDAEAAKASAESIMFPVFTMDENGHVIIEYAERLGTEMFRITDAGHLEVVI